MNIENVKKLKELKLPSMANYYQEFSSSPDFLALDFEQKLSILLDYEMTSRANKKAALLVKQANFKIKPDISTIDYEPERNLKRDVVLDLASCTWVSKYKNVIISGATGTGKTYLASSLGYRACIKLLI